MIRPAAPADAQALLPLCLAHARHERAELPSAPAVAALQRALTGERPALHAWVLEQEGALQGYASGSPAYCTWSASAYFLMDCLFVEEDHRGRGHGRALLQAVAAHARRHGCSRLEWVTPAWNETAIGFYVAVGAEPQERMRFRLGL